eukprot:4207106-Prymnesium_polylepis.1
MGHVGSSMGHVGSSMGHVGSSMGHVGSHCMKKERRTRLQIRGGATARLQHDPMKRRVDRDARVRAGEVAAEVRVEQVARVALRGHEGVTWGPRGHESSS